MSRFKLFTHTDLDGVGCHIVAGHFLGFSEVDVEFCDYPEIDEAVTKFIESGAVKDYERIFITDISVNAETADLIAHSIMNDRVVWRLIDHHKTAEWLNKFSWALVQVEDDYGKSSGTDLFFDYLSSMVSERPSNYVDIDEFAENVRMYDTWEWQTKYDDINPKELNDLLGILGRDRFIERFSDYVFPDFDDTERLLLDLEREKIESYIEKKREKAYKGTIGAMSSVTVFADRYQSELGNALAEDHDVAVMINPDQSVSLRTQKDHVDVSEIAKKRGGGGHAKAAGFPLPMYADLSFIDEVMNNSKEDD